MRISPFLFLASSLSVVLANLPVKYKVTLSCNVSSPGYTGCLRGMTCDDGEACTKPAVRTQADSLFFLKPELLDARSKHDLTFRPHSHALKWRRAAMAKLCEPDSIIYTVR